MERNLSRCTSRKTNEPIIDDDITIQDVNKGKKRGSTTCIGESVDTCDVPRVKIPKVVESSLGDSLDGGEEVHVPLVIDAEKPGMKEEYDATLEGAGMKKKPAYTFYGKDEQDEKKALHEKLHPAYLKEFKTWPDEEDLAAAVAQMLRDYDERHRARSCIIHDN